MAWAFFSIFPPGLPVKVAMVVSLVRMAALYAFLAWVALRKESPALEGGRSA